MKNQLKNNFQSGFTLAEILAAIAISLLVSGGAILLYQTGQKAYRSGNAELEVLQNGRVILDKISRELRQSNEIATDLPVDETQPPSNLITFRDGHITPIRYISYKLENNQIIRTVTHYYFTGTDPVDPNNWVVISSRDPDNNPPIPQDEGDPQIIAEYISKFEIFGDKVININISCENKDQVVNYQTKLWPRNI